MPKSRTFTKITPKGKNPRKAIRTSRHLAGEPTTDAPIKIVGTNPSRRGRFQKTFQLTNASNMFTCSKCKTVFTINKVPSSISVKLFNLALTCPYCQNKII